MDSHSVMPNTLFDPDSQRMPYMATTKIHSMSVLMSISRWATQRHCAAAEHLLRVYPLGQHRPKFMFPRSRHWLQGGEQKVPRRSERHSNIRRAITDRPPIYWKAYRKDVCWPVTAIHSVLSGGDGVPNWPRQATCWATVRGIALLPPDSAFSTERNVPFLFILAMKKEKSRECRFCLSGTL